MFRAITFSTHQRNLLLKFQSIKYVYKSVRYTTLEFGDTFKELRSLELYKSLYTTEVDKNYEKIDQKVISFKERFKLIKERMGRPEYERNDRVKAVAKIPKLTTIDGLEQNLTQLYDFHCKITSSRQEQP